MKEQRQGTDFDMIRELQLVLNLEFQVIVENMEALKKVDEEELLPETVDILLKTIELAFRFSKFSQGYRIKLS